MRWNPVAITSRHTHLLLDRSQKPADLQRCVAEELFQERPAGRATLGCLHHCRAFGVSSFGGVPVSWALRKKKACALSGMLGHPDVLEWPNRARVVSTASKADDDGHLLDLTGQNSQHGSSQRLIRGQEPRTLDHSRSLSRIFGILGAPLDSDVFLKFRATLNPNLE